MGVLMPKRRVKVKLSEPKPKAKPKKVPPAVKPITAWK